MNKIENEKVEGKKNNQIKSPNTNYDCIGTTKRFLFIF